MQLVSNHSKYCLQGNYLDSVNMTEITVTMVGEECEIVDVTAVVSANYVLVLGKMIHWLNNFIGIEVYTS